MSKHKSKKPKSGKTMTKKALAANRENAAHSTGPNTLEGKDVSSRNAEKNGDYSKQLQPGEDPSDFEILWYRLFDEMKPTNDKEFLYFDEFVWSVWLVKRVQLRMFHIENKIPGFIYANQEFDRLSRVYQRLSSAREKARRQFEAEQQATLQSGQEQEAPRQTETPAQKAAPPQDESELSFGHKMALQAAKAVQEAGLAPPPDPKMGSFRTTATVGSNGNGHASSGNGSPPG